MTKYPSTTSLIQLSISSQIPECLWYSFCFARNQTAGINSPFQVLEKSSVVQQLKNLKILSSFKFSSNNCLIKNRSFYVMDSEKYA